MNRLLHFLLFIPYLFILPGAQSLLCYDCATFGDGSVDCADGECESDWCVAAIVKTPDGKVTMSKSCSPTHPASELSSGCLRVSAGGTESTICGCNDADHCNSEGGLARLLDEHLSQFDEQPPPPGASSTASCGQSASSAAVNVAPGEPHPATAQVTCVKCISPQCELDDEGGQTCTGASCHSATTHDKIKDDRISTKTCGPVPPFDGRAGCQKVVAADAESVACVCNTADCNSRAGIERLMRDSMTVVDEPDVDAPSAEPSPVDEPTPEAEASGAHAEHDDDSNAEADSQETIAGGTSTAPTVAAICLTSIMLRFF